MRGFLPRFSGRFLALAGAAAVALSTAAGGGANPSTPDAAQLRAHADSLAARSHRALLDLYSAETQLAAANARLAAVKRQVAHVHVQRALVRREVGIAAHALAVSQRQLAEHLKALYEQGQPDPLALILGASSLDEALSSIDALNRVADQDRSVVRQTRRTRRTLTVVSSRLAARTAELAALEQQASGSVAALEQARSQRLTLLSSLRSQERFNRSRIASLEATALAAQTKTQQLTSTVTSTGAAPAPDGPTPAPAAGRTLTVTSTGYALPGRTATGLPVGWGIVAVDPSVIPLGTHMTIPGYGEGVAADTGGAVRGAMIDLWFPSLAQALAWGRRTVTITLH